MKSINQTYHIVASASDIWQALTNSKDIKKWGAGPAKMDDKVGTKFSLWGGDIWGKNIEVIPEKKLVQEWYSKENEKWEKPSIVTITLIKEEKGIRLFLHQTDLPDAFATNIANGWRDYYLEPLKSYVEEKAKV